MIEKEVCSTPGDVVFEKELLVPLSVIIIP